MADLEEEMNKIKKKKEKEKKMNKIK